MSSRPNSATVARRAPRGTSTSLTSPASMTALVPCSRTRAATASRSAGVRAAIATWRPPARRSAAIAAPMPLPAPVTIATRPVSRNCAARSAIRASCSAPAGYLRRRSFALVSAGGSQPASRVASVVPGRDDLVDPVEHVRRQAGRQPRPSCDSSCSIVRGPMIGAVTAGWRARSASAMSMSEIPASSASDGKLLDGVELRAGSPAGPGRSGRAPGWRGWSSASPGPCGSGRSASRPRAGSTGSPPCRTSGRWAALRPRSPRTRIEYGGCSQLNRSRPRRSATHCASTMCDAGIRRAPEVADLAGAHQIGQGAEGLVEVGGRVGAVDLVEVDPVGAEPAQAVLDLHA